MAQLIGTAPNQVPTNGDLGSAAFMDSSAFYNTGLNPVFRNRIINGDMRIAQRGTSFSGGGYHLDRWLVDALNNGNFSYQQVTDAPPRFSNSLRISTTTSFSANSYQFYTQPIEGLNLVDFGLGTSNASTFTVSFWVKSSLTGVFSLSLTNVNNDYSYPTTYTINTASTWEYKTITVPGPTTGTWLNTNGVGMRLKFDIGCGSFYEGNGNAWVAADRHAVPGTVKLGAVQNATWQITGVQVERGPVATSFEFRPYQTEMALCQRYYNQASNMWMSGLSYSSSGVDGLVIPFRFPVEMRANPTITFSGGNDGGSIAALFSGGVSTSQVNINLRSTSGSDNYVWFANFTTIASAEI